MYRWKGLRQQKKVLQYLKFEISTMIAQFDAKTNSSFTSFWFQFVSTNSNKCVIDWLDSILIVLLLRREDIIILVVESIRSLKVIMWVQIVAVKETESHKEEEENEEKQEQQETQVVNQKQQQKHSSQHPPTIKPKTKPHTPQINYTNFITTKTPQINYTNFITKNQTQPTFHTKLHHLLIPAIDPRPLYDYYTNYPQTNEITLRNASKLFKISEHPFVWFLENRFDDFDRFLDGKDLKCDEINGDNLNDGDNNDSLNDDNKNDDSHHEHNQSQHFDPNTDKNHITTTQNPLNFNKTTTHKFLYFEHFQYLLHPFMQHENKNYNEKNFLQLCQNIKTNFDVEKSILTLDRNMVVVDGLHRAARFYYLVGGGFEVLWRYAGWEVGEWNCDVFFWGFLFLKKKTFFFEFFKIDLIFLKILIVVDKQRYMYNGSWYQNDFVVFLWRCSACFGLIRQ